MSDIDNDKNIEKLLPIKLLDFLLFHTKGMICDFCKTLEKYCERVASNKISEKQQIY